MPLLKDVNNSKFTILLIVIIIFITVVILIYNILKVNKKKEGFESEMNLENLISQYEKLGDEDKLALSKIIGTPVYKNDLIPKSAIPPQRECPKCDFDSSEYVKRSSIPPCPEQKPCIAPKVVIDGELCKKQACPPCPTNVDTKVETVRVPVFITKVVKENKDGSQSVHYEKGTEEDVKLAEDIMAYHAGSDSVVDNETEDFKNLGNNKDVSNSKIEAFNTLLNEPFRY